VNAENWAKAFVVYLVLTWSQANLAVKNLNKRALTWRPRLVYLGSNQAKQQWTLLRLTTPIVQKWLG
jgi:hypothetical protein